MARAAGRGSEDRTLWREAVAWYRERLAEPAPPPEAMMWPPVALGPTWQRTPEGLWLLPERSLGWEMMGWCAQYLQHKRGDPWQFTMEQARFLLWWYAVDDDGDWCSRDAVLQRLKGWGKDPIGATLCANEAFGPARCDGSWNDLGQPGGMDVPEAWVQTAAVALEQTKNTMRLFPGLFTDEAKARFRLHIGKEMIHGLGDTRLIQAVTSSPATLEGARSTFVLLNETHHWKANNEGHEMAAVIRRNAAKSEGGAARTLRITNAYEPGEDSVAQQDREAYELAAAGLSMMEGLLYDSLEAPPDAPLVVPQDDDEPLADYRKRVQAHIAEVIRGPRGDAVWLSAKAITKEVLDTRNPASRSRRYWLNQIDAAEDAWMDPRGWDVLARPGDVTDDKADVTLFFDGSKSDDATGLMACRMDDGHLITLGMWQPSPGGRVDRDDVDASVRLAHDTYKVVGFYGDPSHAKVDDADDEATGERYWDEVMDEWHRRYGRRLRLWATPGARGHSVMWDMTSPARTQAFTAAAERFVSDVKASGKALDDAEGEVLLTHDGDSRLRIHVHNARRAPNRYGVSLRKEHRESARKVDLAVCAVGARMVRRDLINSGKWRPRNRRANFV